MRIEERALRSLVDQLDDEVELLAKENEEYFCRPKIPRCFEKFRELDR